jgi:hypothetical protein
VEKKGEKRELTRYPVLIGSVVGVSGWRASERVASWGAWCVWAFVVVRGVLKEQNQK